MTKACISAVVTAWTLSTAGAPGAALEDWPSEMTPKDVSARTNVHDGYMLRVEPLSVAPVEQSRQLTSSQSTLDYMVGYSPKLQRWVRLPNSRLLKGVTEVGVHATLRAVQAGGENWQVVMTGPTGRVKRLWVTAYQPRGPKGQVDCFADYLTQQALCEGRTAQVLWFVDASCLLPGISTFALQDQPSGGEQAVARLTVTAPGKLRAGQADPCEVKPTPVSEHDQDPAERAFQRLAQQESTFSRVGLNAADSPLFIQLVSEGHPLLADDRGRQTGFEATTQVVQEQIPDSSYHESPAPPALAADPQARPIRSIVVAHPESREYVLHVRETESKPFWLTVSRFEEGRSITLIQTDPHVSSDIAYRIRLDPEDVRQLHVLGDFSGQTQAPGTDRLLTFASPTTLRTELPAGATRTDVLIFYAAGIAPDSFVSKLNGRPANGVFHPYKGWREVVSVPLSPGVNRLDLAIKGMIDRKRRTEKVRLTFVVPN